MSRLIRFPLLLLAVLLTGAGLQEAGPDGPREVVAVVDGADIYLEDFRTYYADYLLETGLRDDFNARKVCLAGMITARLLVRDARASGIEGDPAYRHAEEEARRRLLIEAYLQRALFDTMQVRESELKDMFVRVNTKLKARHLYARTAEQAEALYRRLLDGETFEALAREVFADTALANQGGDVGTFGFDEMDPDFEDAAYGLEVGEISKPVHTALGYSIIQVEARSVSPILTETEFAQKRSKLRRYVLHRKRVAAREELVRGLAESLDITFDAPASQRLLGQITGVALMPSGEERDTWLGRPLVSFGAPGHRETWTIADFRQKAAFTTDEQRAQARSEDDLAQLIRGLVVREALLERARAQQLDTIPEYRAALTQVLDDWVLKHEQERLLEQVSVPEDTLRAYFNRYGGEFTSPERVEVWEILAERKANLDALAPTLTGDTFEQAARVHSIRPGADAAGGYLGYLSREQFGLLAGRVFDAAEGQILGPIEVSGRYVMLKVGGRKPPAPMTYEEARGEIEKRLKESFARRMLNAHLRDLRARYPVTIYDSTVASMRLVG